MPYYLAPNSDVTRLAFMNKAVKTAVSTQLTSATPRLSAPLIADLTTHHTAYKAAYDNAEAALSQRKIETAESAAAMSRLEMFIRHIWTAVYNRAQRDGLSVGVLGYYKMDNDGGRPKPSSREEWLGLGSSIVEGDAKAVANGFPLAVNPSALELQAALDAAVAESNDVPIADDVYDEAQAAVATLRPAADALIKRTRAELTFSTYEMDAASQRRVMRNHGATYRYLVGMKRPLSTKVQCRLYGRIDTIVNE